MIILIAKHPAWGASDNFYRAFKSQGFDVVLLCLKIDKYERTKLDNIVTILDSSNIDFWLEEASKPRNTVMFFAVATIKSLFNKFERGRILSFIAQLRTRPSIFLTSSLYLENSAIWNPILDKCKFGVRFAQPHLVKFSEKNVMLLNTMQYDDVDITKNERITVSFAPGLKRRAGRKGSDVVDKGVILAKEKEDFDYDYIEGVPFYDCIRRKAKSHIFIDQVMPRVGGIGKNGTEALALNCITMASINEFNPVQGDYYDLHPVINVLNAKDVSRELIRLVSNKEELNLELKKVSDWKYHLDYKNTVDYMLEVFTSNNIQVSKG